MITCSVVGLKYIVKKLSDHEHIVSYFMDHEHMIRDPTSTPMLSLFISVLKMEYEIIPFLFVLHTNLTEFVVLPLYV